MEVHAKARFIRMAPRKIRLIARLIQGISVMDADAQLSFVGRAAGLPVRKLLLSAIANAEHNFRLERPKLWVKSIRVDGGPTIKRFRPRAMGRAAPIRKRTSHIMIILSDDARPVKTKGKIKKAATVKKAAPKAKAKETVKAS